MTYRTQNARLMRRLGFVADPAFNRYPIPPKQGTYWRSTPAQACVVTLHDTRYTEAYIVRASISAAITMTLREVRDKMDSVMSAVGHAHEEQAYQFGQQQRKGKS